MHEVAGFSHRGGGGGGGVAVHQIFFKKGGGGGGQQLTGANLYLPLNHHKERQMHMYNL